MITNNTAMLLKFYYKLNSVYEKGKSHLDRYHNRYQAMRSELILNDKPNEMEIIKLMRLSFLISAALFYENLIL